MSDKKVSEVYREIHNLPRLSRLGIKGVGHTENVEENFFLHELRNEGADCRDVFSEELIRAVEMRLEDMSLNDIGTFLGVSRRVVSGMISKAMVEWEDFQLGQ